ncbi:hypothetical protein HYR54_00600 [Candidatus Acetothermia bacterium]|nr:hypothetical protein [Candidatus Acetothermia bacterium]
MALEKFSIKDRFLYHLDFIGAEKEELIERFFQAFPDPAGDVYDIELTEGKEKQLGKFQDWLKKTLEIIYDFYVFHYGDQNAYRDYLKVRLEDGKQSRDQFITNKAREFNKALAELNRRLRELNLQIHKPGGPANLEIRVSLSANQGEIVWRLLRFIEGNPLEWMAKLGRCPHCMRFFVKNRKDQLFKSNSHASAFWKEYNR